jgi:hypothetical protein
LLLPRVLAPVRCARPGRPGTRRRSGGEGGSGGGRRAVASGAGRSARLREGAFEVLAVGPSETSVAGGGVGGSVRLRGGRGRGLRRMRRLRARSVALQVAFERQTLKPVISLDRLYLMGLKGYRLWVMGQLDSTCRAAPLHQTPSTAATARRAAAAAALPRCSAAGCI